MSGARYPNVKVKLTGGTGNGFLIAATVRQALKRAGVPKAQRDEFMEEALSGDYDNVLQTCMRWVEVS